MRSERRFAIAILIGVLCSFGCMCGMCGGCASRDDVNMSIKQADKSWDEGRAKDPKAAAEAAAAAKDSRKAAAVAEYMRLYDEQFATKDEKVKFLTRIVEFEIGHDNAAEAKKWIERGVKDGIEVDYPGAKAKDMLAEAKKEHAKRQAELAAAKESEEKARKGRGSVLDEIGKALFPEPIINKEQYDAIREGMSYAEVVNIIGHSGEEQGSSRFNVGNGVLVTKSYSWKNDDGSNMLAIFQNDRLTTKGQAGLRHPTAEFRRRQAEKRQREEDAKRLTEAKEKEAAKEKERAVAAAQKEIAEERERQRKKEEAERPERERREAAERPERERREAAERAERERKAEADRAALIEKDAATMLRLARNLYDGGDKWKARRDMEALIKKYPNTKAAAEAKRLLKFL